MTDPAQTEDELSAADIDYLLNDSEGQEVLSQALNDFLTDDEDEDTEDTDDSE